MKQKDYAIIDVETTLIQHGKIPQTKFWGYADSRGYKKFKTSKALAAFLRSEPSKTILHHSNFDVLQLLVDGISNIEIRKCHNAKLITCGFGDHTLLNTYAVFPLGMKAIFEAFGYEKTDLGQLAKRNYDDCVLGLECFLALDEIIFNLVGVSPLERNTIAATGFGAAEKMAGKMPKDLRFMEAYRGGRVEVFDLRLATLSGYDINSSYPFSFLDCPKKDNLLHIGVWTKDWHCPLFDEFSTDILLFPNGKFTSWVYESTYEKYIKPYAEKTRVKILKKYRIDFSWLKRLENLITTIYEKKNKSTGAIKLACKLLINAMYGRIGLRGSSERARFLDYRPDGDNIACYRLGKRWLAFDQILREPRSNFPFAAFITDNARGRLYSAFKQNETFYGDTDSVFCRDGRKNFSGIQGEGLGQWGYKGRKNFQARNVKDYIFGGEETLKGGKGNTVWTLKRFAQGKGAMEVNKERRTELRKREVLEDGRTNPLIVP